MLGAAEKNGCPCVVMISSTAVYGIADHHPLYKDDPQIGVIVGTERGLSHTQRSTGTTAWRIMR